MKIAISIPDDVFDTAELLGKRLGVSRSRLYATALADFIAKHHGKKITEQLDAVYGREESALDPGVRNLQRRSVDRDAW